MFQSFIQIILLLFLFFFTVSCEVQSPPTFTVTSPNGGEEWEAGSSHLITWDSYNHSGNYVGIKLYKSGSYVSSMEPQYGSGMYDYGSYTWSIPYNQTELDDYTVKIYSLKDSSDYDFSDEYFTVTSPSSIITVTSPNGGEDWEAGSSHAIT